MSSFFVENFGCRATQADGAAIERELLDLGLDRASVAQQAEVVILNTCTVTASADRDVRASIRRIHRQNPNCRILVTGCYAQRAPEEIAALPGVSVVVGNSHKHAVARIAAAEPSLSQDNTAANLEAQPTGFVPLSSLQSKRGAAPITLASPIRARRGSGTAAGVLVGDIFAHTQLVAAPVFDLAGSERTRPNLKVQDGCSNRCSFCIIPFVRGKSRSLPLAEVLRELHSLTGAGYREVVISGINLGRWGRDLPGRQRFEHLVSAILERTSIERLRLSSVEPMDWSDELIALAASSSRVAKHAHVPMQSGSDRVLRLMHRKYRPWHYFDRVRTIRGAMPTAAIGADVMVGFPGETELDFEQTRAAIEQLPLTYLHVFTYSSRPGTPGAAMEEQVPAPVARERNRILRELAAAKKFRFQQSFVGKVLSAITLNVSECGRTETLTDNYLKLWLEGRHAPNQIVNVHVEDIEGDTMTGRLAG